MNKVKYNKKLNFSFIIFLIFLTLKLSGVISWTWLWVTSPLWIPFVLLILTGIITFFVVIFLILIGVKPKTIEEKVNNLTKKLKS